VDETSKQPIYSCNIDFSFSTPLNNVGIGLCLKDDEGCYVLAKTAWFSPLCMVETEKVVGPHTTLGWMADLQFDNVGFVIDSKKVAEYFHTCNNDIT